MVKFEACKKQGIAKELTKRLFDCTLEKGKRCEHQFDFGGRLFCRIPIMESIINDRKKEGKRD